jgi:hypothetical protein
VKPIAYRLDDHRGLLDPNVGDAELRDIAFRTPDVTLRLALMLRDGGEAACEIRLTGVTFFAMESNLVQNVIEDIFIHDELDAATLALDARLGRQLGRFVPGHRPKMLHMVPIAGADLVALCDDVAIFREEA